MELSNTIWLTCYFVVLLGLSGYGLHRYLMVYLFLKNSRNKPEPLRRFERLPTVTVSTDGTLVPVECASAAARMLGVREFSSD